MTVDLIVNPASGPRSRRLARGDRTAYAMRILHEAGAGRIRHTETAAIGDAARAVKAGLAAGTDLVLVWGGDGTLNEAAGVLTGTGVPLGIVPGGSGNGLARALGLPLHPEAALRVAAGGSTVEIDVGHVAGRAFFNLAGLGFDAAIARRFNQHGSRRGLRTYVIEALREWSVHRPATYRIAIDDVAAVDVVAHLVVVANGSQYGHGAQVAADAVLDDGWLDVVAVPPITASSLLRHGWRLFAGSLTHVPGVFAARAHRVTISTDARVALHLDGEVMDAGTSQDFTLQPRALRCRVPSPS